MSDQDPAHHDVRFSAPWDDLGPGLPSGPFRIVVLAELLARGPVSGASPTGERRIRVDRDEFAGVMAGFSLEPRLAVPDPDAGEGKEKLLAVPFPDLKSFSPDAIARAVPRSAELLEVRRLVTELRDRRIEADAFLEGVGKATSDPDLRDRVRAALAGAAAPPPKPAPAAPAAPAAKGSGDEDLDSLLDMVDVSGSAEAAASAPAAPAGASPLDAFLSVVSSSGVGKPVDARAVNEVLAGLDREIGAAVTEVLHHPEVRRLEAEWRGLDFLVRRIDFRAGIRLEVVSTPRDEVGAVLGRIVEEELRGETDVPVSALVVTRAFGNTTPETDLLTELAEQAERVQAPLIVSLSPRFFGGGGMDEVAGTNLLELFDGPAMIRWQSLRQKECSRWLVAAVNGVALRLPFRKGGARVKSFDYAEPGGARAVASPATGLAALLAGSAAATGFAGSILDPRAGGTLEDLPVLEGDLPVEAALDDDRCRDLARNGIAAFTSRPGSDAALLAAAPVVHAPERYSVPDETEAARIRATLPYQVFVARVAAALNAARDRIPAGAGGDEVAMTYRTVLEGVLGREAEVTMRGREITVTPSSRIAGGRAPLTFGV